MDFYVTAFSDTEREFIEAIKVVNDEDPIVADEENPIFWTDGTNDTKDKIFLLSVEESIMYFDTDPNAEDPARRAQVTEYAKAHGAPWYGEYADETREELYGNSMWWLRSRGYSNEDAAIILFEGFVSSSVHFYDVFQGSVRPAMWVDIGA